MISESSASLLFSSNQQSPRNIFNDFQIQSPLTIDNDEKNDLDLSGHPRKYLIKFDERSSQKVHQEIIEESPSNSQTFSNKSEFSIKMLRRKDEKLGEIFRIETLQCEKEILQNYRAQFKDQSDINLNCVAAGANSSKQFSRKEIIRNCKLKLAEIQKKQEEKLLARNEEEESALHSDLLEKIAKSIDQVKKVHNTLMASLQEMKHKDNLAQNINTSQKETQIDIFNNAVPNQTLIKSHQSENSFSSSKKPVVAKDSRAYGNILKPTFPYPVKFDPPLSRASNKISSNFEKGNESNFSFKHKKSSSKASNLLIPFDNKYSEVSENFKDFLEKMSFGTSTLESALNFPPQIVQACFFEQSDGISPLDNLVNLLKAFEKHDIDQIILSIWALIPPDQLNDTIFNYDSIGTFVLNAFQAMNYASNAYYWYKMNFRNVVKNITTRNQGTSGSKELSSKLSFLEALIARLNKQMTNIQESLPPQDDIPASAIEIFEIKADPETHIIKIEDSDTDETCC